MPRWLAGALALSLGGHGAAAQQPPPAPASSAGLDVTLPTVEIIAATPLLGSGVDRDKVPAETTVLDSTDIRRGGEANMTRALSENAPGVTIDETAGNPFQPTLIYHGFQASPLQGNAQGLAVYVNGVRFNRPFGDTVNWDLIPDIAIDRINLEGSNPVFGLNALGGAIAAQLKNGFTYQGADAAVLGGSFDHYQGEAQYGIQKDGIAAYGAVRSGHEGGWRQAQSSDLANFYGDLGWRGTGGEAHINITAAQTRLNGPGTSPVEQLAADPAAVFTAPNLITNKYGKINLSGSYDLTDQTSLQGLLYYDYFSQKFANGNITNLAPCGDGSGLLCVENGPVATDRNGNPIPDFLNGGFYSELAQQSTVTNGFGAALQLTNRSPLFDRTNRFVGGLSFDGGETLYSASTQIGRLIPETSMYAGPGITIDQADGSIAPVRVSVSNAYYGAFFTDIYDVTPSLSANVAGRFNLAQLDLKDQLGAALTGNHSYSRFNPSAGLTWKATPDVSLYASYAEANRAPTPAELTCASPAAPCSFANFFVGDPELKQVVSHTIEAGVRARFRPFDDATLSSQLSFYRTTLDDDILAVNSALQGLQFFQNVGGTLRQGFDVNVKFSDGPLRLWLAYSFIDAEFTTGFTTASPNNPQAHANGNIEVKPGDKLPGVPRHILKAGADYRISDKWSVGGTALAAAGQYLFGDEANLTPKTPPYFVLNLHSQYQLTPKLQLFARIDNVFNAQYYTFGTFSPTSSVPIVQAPGAANPRSYSPAAPIGALVGVRATF